MNADPLDILAKYGVYLGVVGNLTLHPNQKINQTTIICMKFSSTLLTLQLLLILTSCKNASTSNSNKIVETYKETAECLIGEWETEDKSEKNIHFKFSASINGDEVDNRSFSVEQYDKDGNVLNQASGSWQIEKVGQVRADINGGATGFSIKLTNCNRFVVRGRTVYIKL